VVETAHFHFTDSDENIIVKVSSKIISFWQNKQCGEKN
jgi:hypothetical protein